MKRITSDDRLVLLLLVGFLIYIFFSLYLLLDKLGRDKIACVKANTIVSHTTKYKNYYCTNKETVVYNEGRILFYDLSTNKLVTFDKNWKVEELYGK